jgi:hypothetical protein
MKYDVDIMDDYYSIVEVVMVVGVEIMMEYYSDYYQYLEMFYLNHSSNLGLVVFADDYWWYSLHQWVQVVDCID